MSVTNLKGLKPKIWIPPIYTANFKLTVTRSDGTVDDMTNILSYLEIEDGVTETIGRFEFEFWNPNETYTDVWTGGEIVKFYMDYASTATTLRFRGEIEKPAKRGNKLRISGRSKSLDFIDITVTQQYENKSADFILKDIVSKYSSGFTVTNVESSTNSLNKNWYQKPFWDCVQELCNDANFDAYVDANLDWHFFTIGSRKNVTDAIIHTYNLDPEGLSDFAHDRSQIKNRVIVYGANTDGIQVIATAEDSSKLSSDPWKELIYNDENITNEDQAQEVADALLNEQKNGPQQGEVKSITLLATIQPGEQIRVSSPQDGINPQHYEVLSYIHKLDLENGYLSTTLRINKEPRSISHIFKSLIQKDTQKQKTSINPNEMRYSYNFLYDSDSGTHNNTEISGGVLKTSTGNSVGTWTSDTRTTTSNITQAYLLIFGEKLDTITIQISVDNGANYQTITDKELITFTTSDQNLVVKVSFTDENARLDSLSVQYKTG